MHMQIIAERERRTMKVEAEGYGQQTKLIAEGEAVNYLYIYIYSLIL